MQTSDAFSASIEPGAQFAILDAPFGENGVVVEVHGELDIATAPQLRERLTGVIDRSPKLLVVDLEAVDFLDSVSLAILLAARKALAQTSRMAVIVAPDSYPRLIFAVTGVDRSLHVVANRDEALASGAG